MAEVVKVAGTRVSAIRPGYLVSLKTSIHEGVRYEKRKLTEGVREDGAAVREWETIRTVFDPEEYKQATKVRQDARNLVARACIGSAFGMLCPTDQKDVLDAAIRDARAMVRTFNVNAKRSTVRLYVVAGYVADNDEEAAKAIASEVNDLVKLMEKGIANADTKKIRDAANKARDVARMLPPADNSKVEDMVKIARAVANRYVKAGEAAAQEIDLEAIKALQGRRTAFLDMDEVAEMVQINTTKGRAVELAPEEAKPARVRVEVEVPKELIAAKARKVVPSKRRIELDD